MTQHNSDRTLAVTRGESFVAYIISRCSSDKALAAAMRRACNASMQYQSWPLLIDFNVNIERSAEREAYCCVGSAVIATKAEKNGSVALTRALALAYGSTDGAAQKRLSRLLACSSTEECCLCLRPILRIVNSKSGIAVDFAQLLDDLLNFRNNPEKVKARWALDFYKKDAEEQAPSSKA